MSSLEEKVTVRKPIYDRDKGKEWIHRGGRTSEPGRSSIRIECPFCQETFTAYIWSITGGGKKCPDCGAMHTSHGQAYPMMKS